MQLLIFIAKVNLQGERDRKRSSIFWFTFQANLKPGTWRLFQLSHVSAGSPAPGSFLAAYPSHKQRAKWEVEQSS